MIKILITINVLLLLFIAYVIYKKGGLRFLKNRLILLKNISKQQGYNNWHYQARKNIFENMPCQENSIVFLGDSITEFCNWNELFNKQNIKNRGISGDVIKGVINRLDEIIASKPKKIFLMIGTNDLGNRRNKHQIISDYQKLIDTIITKTPKTALYVQSILPTKNSLNRDNNVIMAINRELEKLAEKKNLIYINLFDVFKTANNQLDMSLSYDGLHLNGKGYLLWKEAIKKYIED
ncbi:GDSL-type esterase/lipase family protein [Polaribacter sargassicola]|uniref:GDSL-type esterase/lipase family protein n=1 Tax=Polaribacter sargassicola TaxID=2836891 RepID=UPI001F3CCCAC|nr:GDSL-type esterase/lipase family protein [Polaribacter sp. DS7-9]MCG1036135.1 sialate O-acetylesterase [Polaribacter sp. DS7-9]